MNVRSSKDAVFKVRNFIGEVVFGVEDGMVSTLGSITGIAVGSENKFTVLLAGIVIIAVESISMGIGSFISNISAKEVEEKIIEDEKNMLDKNLDEEKKGLYHAFVKEGWSKRNAFRMAVAASSDKKLMLKEYEYHELGIFPYNKKIPYKNAFFMFFSYIIGGVFPLFPYFFLPISTSIYISVTVTLIGLFLLGVATTFYTNKKPIKAGLRLFLMGSMAFFIGLIVGKTVSFLS